MTIAHRANGELPATANAAAPNTATTATTATTPTRGRGGLKALDRYVGIPLVALLSLRPKRRLPQTITRIGLMKTAAIGDTLLLAGFARDVQHAHPTAGVVLITGTDNRGAATLLDGPFADHVSVAPARLGASMRTLRALDLDVLVDFGSWPRIDALLSGTSAARYTAGFRTAGQYRHFAYDIAVEHSRMLHERENYARLLAAVGVSANASPTIAPPGTLPPDRVPASPFVIFHPWASGYLATAREWPADRWASLAHALHERGRQIVLTGAPGEAARSAVLSQQLIATGATVHDLAGTLSLPEVADLISHAEAVISVNTGVAHLAGLIGARTVSLQGPTSVTRWRPLGPHVFALASALPNCGYLNLGFEYAGQRLDCMDGISVSDVLHAYDAARTGLTG